MQKVKIYIYVYGEYCSFEHMSFDVVYDLTNNLKLNEFSLKEIKKHEFEDYLDFKLVDALLLEGKYYVDIDSIN